MGRHARRVPNAGVRLFGMFRIFRAMRPFLIARDEAELQQHWKDWIELNIRKGLSGPTDRKVFLSETAEHLVRTIVAQPKRKGLDRERQAA